MTNTADAAPTLPPLTMPLEEVMRAQRALRRLRPDPVDDALVLRLIELALKAPTGRNAQNWEFVLVKDRAVKARLARLYRVAWRLFGDIGRRLTAGDPKMQRQLVAVQWQVDHFEEVPVLVVAYLRGFRPLWPPVAVTSYYGSIYPSGISGNLLYGFERFNLQNHRPGKFADPKEVGTRASVAHCDGDIVAQRSRSRKNVILRGG